MGTRKGRLLGIKRGPLSAGRFVQYTRRGGIIAQKWKRPTGPPKSEITRAQNIKFGQASRLARVQPGEILFPLYEAVRGKPWFLYDWLISCAYGRAFWLTDEFGRTWYPMALADDVSKNLDVLMSTPGAVLYRGPTRWAVLAPGTAGQALAFNTTTIAPFWTPGQGPYLIAEAVAASNIIEFTGLDFTGVRSIYLAGNSLAVSVDGAAIRCQFRIAGTLITSGYRYTLQSFSTSGANAANSSTSAAFALVSSGVDSDADSLAQFTAYMGAPSVSGDKCLQIDSASRFTTGNFERGMGMGALKGVGAVTGFTFLASSGNITGGRVRIFGSPFPIL